VIAAETRGEADGRRWRAEHPGETPSLRPIMDGWLSSGVDDGGRSESPQAFAASSESLESYTRGWRRGAGLDQ
jgi:hypothetical protein